MATELGALQWTILADDSDFKRKITAASATMNGFKNYMNDATQSSQAFAGVMGGLITGVVGLGTAAIKNASDVEMLRANFDTLLGSADKGRQLFSDLQKMANVTPFSTQDLAEGSQRLLAMGVNVKDLLPDLQMLGDISLGNKAKFDQLTLAFGQIQSKGKLAGDDLKQLVSVGFNPLQKISQRTGESIDSLTQKMSDGQITFAMVSDEFKRATSEGGQFFGGMDKGSQTLQGRLSTLGDSIAITVRQLVGLSEQGDVIKGGLFDKVTSGVATLIAFIDQNKQIFMDFVQKGLGWLKDNAAPLAGAITGALAPAFAALAVTIAASTVELLPFAIIGAGLALLIQNYIVPNMDLLTGKFNEFKDKVAPIVQGIQDNAIPIFNNLIAKFNEIRSTVGLMAQEWSERAQPVIEFLKAQFMGLWDTIQTLLIPQILRMRDIFMKFWQENQGFLIPMLKTIALVIGGVVAGAIAGVTVAIQGVIWFFGKWLEGINNINEGFANVVRTIKGLPDQIKGAIGAAKDLIDKLNPFHRNSPSLVDNVKKGLSVITDEYSNVQLGLPDVQLNNLSGLTLQGDGTTKAKQTSEVHIHVGMFAGTKTELRKIAETIGNEQANLLASMGAA